MPPPVSAEPKTINARSTAVRVRSGLSSSPGHQNSKTQIKDNARSSICIRMFNSLP